MKFPHGKKVAFTTLDDTDEPTLGNVKPVYDALKGPGIRTTKTSWLRRMLGLLRKETASYYLGDVKDTEYFWGDLCRQHIRYVRNWTFPCLNMLEVNPEMPYRLSGTPYVNLWFSTTDAPDVGDFVRLLTQENVDRLEQAGGLCIVSTHLGKGFVKDGVLDPRVHRIFQALSQKPGWYVPVSEMLDYLVQTQDKGRTLGSLKTAMLETRYLVNKLWPAS